jgi:hypothetical protein
MTTHTIPKRRNRLRFARLSVVLAFGNAIAASSAAAQESTSDPVAKPQPTLESVPAAAPPPVDSGGPRYVPPTNPPPPIIEQVTETRFRIDAIEIDKEERSITFPAKLNMNEGMLEYLIVTEQGKVHEALLSTNIHPFYLNVAALLLKYEKAENFFAFEQEADQSKAKPELNETNSFDVKLGWQDDTGVKRAVFLTEWLQNRITNKTVARAPWVYTGGRVDPNGTYAPQVEGSIIAIYSDPYGAMINSPLEGADNDEIWVPVPELPPLNTEVQVTFLPYKELAAADVAEEK